MRIHNIKSANFLAFLFCFFFLLTTAAFAATGIDTEINKEQEKYDELQNKISQTQKKIAERNKQERNITHELDVLNKKISETKKKANVVSTSIKNVENDIKSINRDIEVKKKKIAEAQGYLKKRIISLYKYGNDMEFNLLMSSTGAHDAMDNSYLLSKIAKQDQMVMEQLTSEKKELEISYNKLAEKKGILQKQSQELNVQNATLKKTTDERNVVLAQVRKQRDKYIAEQREFEKAATQLQSTIRNLLAKKREMNKKKNGKAPVTYYKGGRLAWPVQGKISSTFGTRVHPTFHTRTNHAGIDISAPKGTPIVAADAGEVLFSGWMRGYGNVVIIDHGANLATVYGHMSKTACSENQKVKKGGVIGYVGSTGVSTGNHLHFEVRVNGTATDPMKYLK